MFQRCVETTLETRCTARVGNKEHNTPRTHMFFLTDGACPGFKETPCPKREMIRYTSHKKTCINIRSAKTGMGGYKLCKPSHCLEISSNMSLVSLEILHGTQKTHLAVLDPEKKSLNG